MKAQTQRPFDQHTMDAATAFSSPSFGDFSQHALTFFLVQRMQPGRLLINVRPEFMEGQP
ncbi:MAG TPA: hypothetical protein PK820_15905 [Candidatus Competibacteraceae bacterium]|nr:hypothetical protein [Candidatus Competibacteraceae bacterium]